MEVVFIGVLHHNAFVEAPFADIASSPAAQSQPCAAALWNTGLLSFSEHMRASAPRHAGLAPWLYPAECFAAPDGRRYVNVSLAMTDNKA